MAVVELVVVPRASSDRVGPYAEGALRVRVTRPPADGEANRAVMRLVADALGVPVSTVELVAGARGRRKRLRIDVLDDADVERRLSGLSAN